MVVVQWVFFAQGSLVQQRTYQCFGIFKCFPLLAEKILMLHYLKLGLELIVFQIVGLHYDKFKDQSRLSYSLLLWNQISYQDCNTSLKVICISVSMRLLLLHWRACTITKVLSYILCHCYQLFFFFFFLVGVMLCDQLPYNRGLCFYRFSELYYNL